SFGDYFKEDAIAFAWEFITGRLGIPAERLWVTVHDSDDDAERIWRDQVGVPAERITRCGDKDNFWQMGDTGPCGPCSEIFFDHGPEVWGGPPGTPEEDGDRYVEIWNLVFMQYNQSKDPDGTYVREPLPKPSVDTGMGLERLAAVMQGVHSNYSIDLFQNLISAVVAISGTEDRENASLKVIADHIRSCAFLIVDGVLPSNEGRGYVLRRIIRRALRHGHKLGINGAFFSKLVGPLVAEMGDAYPELREQQGQVERVLLNEEERFAETLDAGMKILDEAIAGISDGRIPGALAFKLYDTYGFPIDLTADVARERELSVDMEGFDQAMQSQRERARAASNFGADYNDRLEVSGETEFTGYEQAGDDGVVDAVFRDGEKVEGLSSGEAGLVVLDRTPFYAESGGQVGDTGILNWPGGAFRVDDTQKQNGVFTHRGEVVEGRLNLGQSVRASVDAERRQAISINHSATHLMHAALREVLGTHVAQKGSLVQPDRLRFDFSHFESMTDEQIEQVENRVNEQIRLNQAVSAEQMALDDALGAGAMALFDEKYGDTVRVLKIGDFSTELCGGIHVDRAGDIGVFKIVAESGVAAGVRRVEAVTGAGALLWMRDVNRRLDRIANMVKGGRDSADEKVEQLLDRNRRLEKELDQLKAKLASSQGTDLAGQAVDIAGVKVLAARLDGVDAKALRDAVDQLKNKLGSAAIVLGAVDDGKVRLVAGVTKDVTGRIKAGDLVNQVAVQVGGKGGGRPDLAQAGGSNPEALDAAIASVTGWVEAQIQG
ncbi:MAG: alanine--tRNA ligase, partial [Gammaproteobacteria bacterium]